MTAYEEYTWGSRHYGIGNAMQLDRSRPKVAFYIFGFPLATCSRFLHFFLKIALQLYIDPITLLLTKRPNLEILPFSRFAYIGADSRSKLHPVKNVCPRTTQAALLENSRMQLRLLLC